MDKTHSEQVERWAEFCRDNPDKFRIHLKKFLDSQIIMARNFYKRLAEKEDGKEIIEKLRKQNNFIKN